MRYAPMLVIMAGGLAGAASARRPPASAPAPVTATLSEWTVKLSAAEVAAGPVTFTVANEGSIPHALEIEGRGLERQTPLVQPGAKATLTLTLAPGNYEVYCPVGHDSHKKLGMLTQLTVTAGRAAAGPQHHETTAGDGSTGAAPHSMRPFRVAGGGPVIQMLPGAFPFPDSAAPVIAAFGAERPALLAQMRSGPYSDNVSRISGTFTVTAWDLGAVRDSVDGVAEFRAADGTAWKVVLDRVQTKDVPHHPRFGGVIRGLYYHGASAVHTPLVPTINSAVALWAVGHLYRNGALVSDSAAVHVMLLSHTRRAPDFRLACWDCSANPIDELQLQITPGPGQPPIPAPGGFLFVNWEGSKGAE